MDPLRILHLVEPGVPLESRIHRPPRWDFRGTWDDAEPEEAEEENKQRQLLHGYAANDMNVPQDAHPEVAKSFGCATEIS